MEKDFVASWIVVPTLGRRLDLLERAVKSVLAIEGTTCCVVGPKISTADLGLESDRIVLVDSKGSLVQAIQEGFALAGDEGYISWIGDDDYLLEGFSEALKEAASFNSELVFGVCEVTSDTGVLIRRSNPEKATALRMLLTSNPVAQPGAFFTKSLFNSVGGIDKQYRLAFDQDMFTRMLLSHPRVLRTCITVARYTEHASTLSSTNRFGSALEGAMIRLRNNRLPIRIFLFWFETLRLLAYWLKLKWPKG